MDVPQLVLTASNGKPDRTRITRLLKVHSPNLPSNPDLEAQTLHDAAILEAQFPVREKVYIPTDKFNIDFSRRRIEPWEVQALMNRIRDYCNETDCSRLPKVKNKPVTPKKRNPYPGILPVFSPPFAF